MKVLIEGETPEEREQLGDTGMLEFNDLTEFALCGRHGGPIPRTMSHLHGADHYILMGQLHELIERLRYATYSRPAGGDYETA